MSENQPARYTVRVWLDGLGHILPSGPPLDLILVSLVHGQRLIADRGTMRLVSAADAHISEEEMHRFAVGDAVTAALDWVCSAAQYSSDLLLAAAQGDYPGNALDLNREMSQRQGERCESGLDFKSHVEVKKRFKEKGGGLIVAIRDNIKAVSRTVYRAANVDVREADAENFMRANTLSPHGHVSGPVFMPCLGRAVRYYCEAVALRRDPATECHGCDSLSVALSLAAERARTAIGRELLITARITGIPGMGFGESGWLLPKPILQHGQAIEQIARQALGKKVVSAVFPIRLWRRFPDPVHEFLIQAGCSAAADLCPTLHPRAVSKDELDHLITRVGLDALNDDMDQDTQRLLQKSGIVSGAGGMPVHLHDMLQEFNEIAFGEHFDKTFAIRRLLDLYPLHKRVLGLLEYQMRPCFGTTNSKFAERLRLAFQERHHRLDTGLISMPADSRDTSLEMAAGWLAFANEPSNCVSTPSGPACSLAALLDSLVDRLNHRFGGEGPIACARTKLAEFLIPRDQARQLAAVASTSMAMRRSLQAISNIIVNLRNFIEHGTDEVDESQLVVTNGEFWPISDWMAKMLPKWQDEDGKRLPCSSQSVAIPDAAKRLALTTQSLSRCLVLTAIALHGARDQLSVDF